MAEKVRTFPTLYKSTAKGGTQVWDIWVEKDGLAGVICVSHGREDGKKQVEREVISKGKNPGKKNETTPLAQAISEAESRWEIKLSRKGYGETVEDSAAVRWASPMLALPYEKQYSKIDWGSAFTQPKLDGFRMMARLDKDGKVSITSRENQPLSALAHLKEVIEAVKFHVAGGKIADVVFDGEAYCHGMALNEIASACKKKSDLSKKIQFHVYDAVMGSADFETRSTFASDFVEAAGTDLLVPVETVKVRNEQELMHCQAQFMEQGYEGAMLRHGNVGYQGGKRSPHLLKVKTFEDAEFEVVDFKMGRGKYAGVPIFVCQTADGNHFDVTAPGNMEEKKALGKSAAEHIGRLLTVKYQYFSKTDEPVPFLPVAKCFRDTAKKKAKT